MDNPLLVVIFVVILLLLVAVVVLLLRRRPDAPAQPMLTEDLADQLLAKLTAGQVSAVRPDGGVPTGEDVAAREDAAELRLAAQRAAEAERAAALAAAEEIRTTASRQADAVRRTAQEDASRERAELNAELDRIRQRAEAEGRRAAETATATARAEREEAKSAQSALKESSARLSQEANRLEAERLAAMALKAEKLVFLTDTPGILRDRNEPGSLIRGLTPDDCHDLIEQGVIDKGMIPKVEACMACLEAGVRKIHIIDGRLRHALLLEIFTHEGIGTQISRDPGNGDPSPRRRVGQAAPIPN